MRYLKTKYTLIFLYLILQSFNIKANIIEQLCLKYRYDLLIKLDILSLVPDQDIISIYKEACRAAIKDLKQIKVNEPNLENYKQTKIKTFQNLLINALSLEYISNFEQYHSKLH